MCRYVQQFAFKTSVKSTTVYNTIRITSVNETWSYSIFDSWHNSHHAFVDALSFYLLYEYHFEIKYQVKNNFFEEKISSTKKRVQQLQTLRQTLKKSLLKIAKYQVKYYNKNHKSKQYVVEKLIMLTIKNLKQKRSSKKLFHKFVSSFKIENKINTQIYKLTLFFIYRIHNIFYVSLLKSYYHKVDEAKAHEFMQVSKLKNNQKMWKIEKIVDKTKNEDEIWYQMKWANWDDEYNQWFLEEEFDNTIELKKKFDERAQSKRKRKRRRKK